MGSCPILSARCRLFQSRRWFVCLIFYPVWKLVKKSQHSKALIRAQLPDPIRHLCRQILPALLCDLFRSVPYLSELIRPHSYPFPPERPCCYSRVPLLYQIMQQTKGG